MSKPESTMVRKISEMRYLDRKQTQKGTHLMIIYYFPFYNCISCISILLGIEWDLVNNKMSHNNKILSL